MRNHILRLICYGRYCLLVAGPTGTDGTVTDVKMNFLVAGDDHNESDDCDLVLISFTQGAACSDGRFQCSGRQVGLPACFWRWRWLFVRAGDGEW